MPDSLSFIIPNESEYDDAWKISVSGMCNLCKIANI